MFHFAGCAFPSYIFRWKLLRLFTTVGFPHSEISGSKVACHLPEAYRRLLRPSSPLRCRGIHHVPFSYGFPKNATSEISYENIGIIFWKCAVCLLIIDEIIDSCEKLQFRKIIFRTLLFFALFACLYIFNVRTTPHLIYFRFQIAPFSRPHLKEAILKRKCVLFQI